jgi:outer membrane biosynthesis protein TonB
MSGTALYEVHLKPDRTIATIVLAKSCGFRILDDYGVAIIKGWSFAKVPSARDVIKIPMTFGQGP